MTSLGVPVRGVGMDYLGGGVQKRRGAEHHIADSRTYLFCRVLLIPEPTSL